ARRMGFTVRLEDGLRVTYYCEGFNDQTRFDRVRAVGERDRPDVVVAGAQLDYPRQVAEAATILHPRRLVLFHPHTDYFDSIAPLMRNAVWLWSPSCHHRAGMNSGSTIVTT